MSAAKLPEHLRALGRETHRLRTILARGLASSPTKPAARGGAPDAFHKFMHDALDAMANDIRALTAIINGPLQQEAANADGDVAAIHRISGRIEQVLSHMIERYRSACGMVVHAADRQPQQLLIRGCREHLLDVDRLLGELGNIIDDPTGAVSAAGLPADESVELPISLKFRPSPAIAELGEYFEERRILEAPPPPSAMGFEFQPARPEPPSGFWSAVGTVALGLFIGNALFGDDCDE